MADVDIDLFGEYDKTDSHPDDTGDNIPLPLVNQGGGSTWEPEHEQETLFGGGRIQERRLTNSYIDSLYKELSKHYSQTSDTTHYDNFRHEGMRLYFKGRDEPLKDTKPNGILTGKPMTVLRVTMLDIPGAMLRPLEQAFSHTNRSNILECLEYFFLYLSSSFNNPSLLLWNMFR